MRVAWTIALLAALNVRHGIAQGVGLPFPVSVACFELNQTVVAQAANGRLAEAEKMLSAALAGGADRTADMCAGLALNNLAALLLATGRLDEGERLAVRSVAILEKVHWPDDLVLLRPLQVLTVIRFELGKTARARESVKKMQSIRVERPQDIALVHGIMASLLYTERKLPEAEAEYLITLRAWEEAGRGNTADEGAVLSALGTLYMEERRFHDARQALDGALAVHSRAKDVVPIDRIRLLNVRGVLHARQQEWREAEQDLRDALSVADRETWVNPVALRTLLINYARALRKNHRMREARTIEARTAALGHDRSRDAAVDVSELLPIPNLRKK